MDKKIENWSELLFFVPHILGYWQLLSESNLDSDIELLYILYILFYESEC